MRQSNLELGEKDKELMEIHMTVEYDLLLNIFI